MRYTRIDIESQPKHRATLSREPGSEFIDVRIEVPGLNRTHQVQADDRQDQWSMAECLQEVLDGRRGAGGDIREYFNAIQLFAD